METEGGAAVQLRIVIRAVPGGLASENGLLCRLRSLFSPHEAIGTYEEGPLAAVDAFLSETAAFAVDHERERYLLTYNPRGFLKRVAP